MKDERSKIRKPGISVIVCCYNSAKRLPQTLEHLSRQNVPEGFLWEIILVDNASTDGTAAEAINVWNAFKNHTCEFKIITEPEPGQMNARKTGARAARFDGMVFCDDDNWLAPDYIFLAKQMLDLDNKIGAGGGQNKPATDAAEYPPWFESYADKYALGIPAAASGDVTHRGFVLGAGLVTRTDLFLDAFADEYPSLLPGRNGNNLSTGDDFEYCKRLLLWNYRLYYDENMKLEHFIPAERLTLPYRERLMEGINNAGKILHEYDRAIHVMKQVGGKSRSRLLMLAPFRILFARLGLSKRSAADEALKWYYLSSFNNDNNTVRASIKKILKHDK